MYSFSPYLDELKRLKRLENDADLSRFLKVSRAHISQIRNGAYMGEAKCFELAELLKLEPLELLSLNRAIRNTERKISDYWYGIHQQVKDNTKTCPAPPAEA